LLDFSSIYEGLTSCLIKVHSTFKGQVQRSFPKPELGTKPRPWPSALAPLVGWAEFPGFSEKRQGCQLGVQLAFTFVFIESMRRVANSWFPVFEGVTSDPPTKWNNRI